jgi:hypothetical protein
MAIGLFAVPPLRREGASRALVLRWPRDERRRDRGWAVIEVLVVLLITSIIVATIILVAGGMANAPR